MQLDMVFPALFQAVIPGIDCDPFVPILAQAFCRQIV